MFDLKNDKLPVIFKIAFKGQQGLFELTAEYTAYPTEDEILVQDGLQYLIIKKEYMTVDDIEACCIWFAYPAKK